MGNKAFSGCLLYFLLIIAGINPATAQLSMTEIFSDHMVLQRDQPLRLWGIADSDQTVHIEFAGKKRSLTAESSGNWSVTFPAMSAGGPYSIIVVSKDQNIRFDDVYIGDVWLCSGQSNMEWTVENSLGFENTIKEADDPLIRHIKVPHAYSELPESELPVCEWVVASPETVAAFTAVGYYFAQNLRNHHNVPIGLLNSSWGGSRIEAWMSAESLGPEDVGESLKKMKAQAEEAFRRRQQVLDEKFPGLGKVDQGLVDGKPLWAAIDMDDSDWITMDIPGLWEEQGLEGFDGIGWYRISMTLEADDLNEDAVLRLAKIDDSDKVWINGHYVGGTDQAWDKLREYIISRDFLRKGQNIITVRVEDTGGGGGIYGDAVDLFFKTGKKQIDLSGTYKFKAGSILSFNPASNAHHTPTLLYNKMIHPILNFPIKGVIWYQGESNAGNEQDAYQYRDLFKNMITDWRNGWRQPELPFMYVQLANFMQAEDQPVDSYWALLRESQNEASELKNVGEAVIIDLGEANDIHPRNKHDVGYRLSLAARKWAYNEDIVYAGPKPVSHRPEGRKVVITFDQDLVTTNRYGYVNSLALAGPSGKFFWARGFIKGNILEVWAEEVPQPQYLRFAWANNPHDFNLYNAEGLPVSPFRLKLK